MPSAVRRTQPNSYEVAKEIDGHPGREWTYAVFNSRAEALRFASPAELFYEPVSTYDQLVAGMKINLDQLQWGADIDIMHRMRLGLRWHRSNFYAPSGRLPQLRPEDEFVGLHMADVISLEHMETESPTIVFMNRWEGWGDERRGYLTRADFDDYVVEIWVNRPSTSGASPAQARDMQAATFGPLSNRLTAVRRAWATERPIATKAVLVSDRPHTLHRIQVTSLRTKRTVRIIELRHEVFGGIGRVHLQVGGGEPAELDELFVWPERRRCGYGSFLLHQAVQAARDAGHRELTAPIYDGDLLSVWGPAAKAFLSNHGFAVHPVGERMPSCQRRGYLSL